MQSLGDKQRYLLEDNSDLILSLYTTNYMAQNDAKT